MNKKTFLDNLSRISKKYRWKKERGEGIRTKNSYGGCPIQTIYHSRSGVWMWYDYCAYKLNISEALCVEIVHAADHTDSSNRFRQAMLRRLGLPLDKD